jgi:hypothetical protein
MDRWMKDEEVSPEGTANQSDRSLSPSRHCWSIQTGLFDFSLHTPPYILPN